MIINPIPRIRAPFAPALAATPHLHEGKFAKLNAAGQMELASSPEEAQGIITEPDSYAAAQAGNAVGASLLYKSFGGIVEVQLGQSAAVSCGDLLTVASDGAATLAAAGEGDDAAAAAVAMAVEPVSTTTAGQLIKAVFIH